MRPLRLTLLFALFVINFVATAAAKNNWESDMFKWVASNDINPNCKVRYTTGVYRSDLGDKPVWNMMSPKMFKWFSQDGVKLAPSVCLVGPKTKDKAAYRILFSVSPMKTVSRTTHGSEVRTTSEPFNANVASRTTYSDGSTANGTATINGEQTSTVVVPTETTISQSSVAQYMYTYRVNGDQLELIATDSVVFSRVAVSSSDTDAAASQLGAGIGNLIRASGDRHRADKLYEEALKAILADSQDSETFRGAVAESTASNKIPDDKPEVPQSQTLADSSSPSLHSMQPVQHIDTPVEHSATDKAETQFDLGKLYEFGHGVPQDYAQAILWYRKAAEQSYADAEFRLGVLYANGHGVSLDQAQSAAWFQKAAEHGIVDAQESLGMDYLTGGGVQADYAKAYFWLEIALSSKTPEVVEGLRATECDMAASALSPADRTRVQERVREWLEQHSAR